MPPDLRRGASPGDDSAAPESSAERLAGPAAPAPDRRAGTARRRCPRSRRELPAPLVRLPVQATRPTCRSLARLSSRRSSGSFGVQASDVQRLVCGTIDPMGTIKARYDAAAERYLTWWGPVLAPTATRLLDRHPPETSADGTAGPRPRDRDRAPGDRRRPSLAEAGGRGRAGRINRDARHGRRRGRRAADAPEARRLGWSQGDAGRLPFPDARSTSSCRRSSSSSWPIAAPPCARRGASSGQVAGWRR